MTFPDIQEEKVPFTSRVEGRDICGPVLHTSKESGGLFTSRGPEREYAALNLRVFMNVVWNRFNCFKDTDVDDSVAGATVEAARRGVAHLSM